MAVDIALTVSFDQLISQKVLKKSILQLFIRGRDMEFYYDIQDGNYVWHNSQDDAQKIGPVISVLFDKSSGTLLKHGTPELVQSRYQQLRKAFEAINSQDDLVLISGAVPLEKINKAISCSGTCRVVFADEIKAVSQFQSSL